MCHCFATPYAYNLTKELDVKIFTVALGAASYQRVKNKVNSQPIEK